MAEKNILIKKHNGTDWDNIYPVTKGQNVGLSDGRNAEDAINTKADLVGGKVPLEQLPDSVKKQLYVVLNSSERTALTSLRQGDMAFETSTKDTYIYDGSAWQVMADADWANVNLTWANIANKPSSTTAQIDSAVTNSHTHSNKAVLDATTASYTTALNTKLSGIATGATLVAGSSVNGNILINGSEDVVYSHPTDDGNLHVPATSTTNSGKFLKAGSTAGSAAWTAIVPTDITLNASNRFVTDTEKATWNAKSTVASPAIAYNAGTVTLSVMLNGAAATSNATIPNVTTSANGLMLATDKSKLDGISTGANVVVNSSTNGNILVNGTENVVYAHPTGDGNLHVPANGTSNNGKVLKAGSTAGSLSWASLTASDITQDASSRFVTDTEKATWNAKASTSTATTSVNGLMSTADKSKLDGIAAGANNYLHPTGEGNNHVPAGGSSGNILRWSSAGVAAWANPSVLDNSHNHYNMTRQDVTGQTLNLNSLTLSGGPSASPSTLYYVERSTGGAANITNIPVSEPFILDVELIRYASATDYITRQVFVSATTKIVYTRWCVSGTWSDWYQSYDANNPPPVVTTGVKGLMSPTDKSKLDGITTGANVVVNSTTNGNILVNGAENVVYAHPTGDGNLHVPATSTTNSGKFLKAGATAGSIAWTSLAATDVPQTASYRFVTDTEKATWNAKASTTVATTSASGLMSAADKTKLDGLSSSGGETVYIGSSAPTNPPTNMIWVDTAS